MKCEKYKLKEKYDYRRFKSLGDYVAKIAEEKKVSRTEAKKIAYREIPLEKAYQTKILEALRREFPDGRFRKVAQGFGSVSGEPDLDGVLGGKYIAIEVKRPLVGDPTELQKKAVRQIRQAGGCAMIASYPDEVVAAVYAYVNREPYWYELTGCTEAVAEGDGEVLE